MVSNAQRRALDKYEREKVVKKTIRFYPTDADVLEP